MSRVEEPLSRARLGGDAHEPGAGAGGGREPERVPSPAGAACPLPLDRYPTVTMAHGGGGTLSRQLVEGLFLEAYGGRELARLDDGAVLRTTGGRIAFSTDSYVITPPFFPGGDIGSLAVHGTVNDLAMCGARPTVLSVSFILEEGFAMEDLWRIARSVRSAAEEAEVEVVTGDTKVVDRGKGDGVFINTSGIGVVPEGVDVGAHRVRPGDAVLVTGSIADHGIAILSLREGLEFETTLETDSAPLNGLVASLLETFGDAVHCLRDPTRGGVASTLVETVRGGDGRSTGVRSGRSDGAEGEHGPSDGPRPGIVIDEASLPVTDPVRGACEILGLDPLYVANEGKAVVFLDNDIAAEAVELLRKHPLGARAVRIGTVVEEHPGKVVLRSRIGGNRVVEMLSGEQLPRIC